MRQGCTNGQAGHGLLAVQEVVAAARAWRDGLVTASGRVAVILLEGGERAVCPSG